MKLKRCQVEASGRQQVLPGPALSAPPAPAAEAPGASTGGEALETIQAYFNKHPDNSLPLGGASKVAAPQQRASIDSGRALSANLAADMGGNGQKGQDSQQVPSSEK